MSLDELKGQLENDPLYTKIATQDGRLTARRKVHFLSADKVEVFKDGDTFNIESKPFSPIWFIDFGRNFGNVKWIAETIKLIK